MKDARPIPQPAARAMAIDAAKQLAHLETVCGEPQEMAVLLAKYCEEKGYPESVNRSAWTLLYPHAARA